jgi:hypothetical protein
VPIGALVADSATFAPIPLGSVFSVELGHLTADEIPFEFVLLLVGFVGGVAAERLRRVRARRR